MTGQLLNKQVRLLEYLTSGGAIFGEAGSTTTVMGGQIVSNAGSIGTL